MLLLLSAALLLQVRAPGVPGDTTRAANDSVRAADSTKAQRRQISIRLGPGGNARLAENGDTVVTDTSISGTDTSVTTRRLRSRRPRIVAPELVASAFSGSTAARAMLERARAARLRQDSSLRSYDVNAYQRISVGMGFKKIGRDRLIFRKEHAARVRWQRDVGATVDITGSRKAIPVISGIRMDDKDRREFDEGMREMDSDMAPIPYYPGRDALWIGSNGLARAEVDEESIIHPLAAGAEAYYTYRVGDSASIRTAERMIRLRELEITARKPQWNLIVGSFWFDEESGQLVRAVYRMSTEIDIWAKVKEEEPEDYEEIPAFVKPMISPMRAQLQAITIEYGLYGGKYWLPKLQAAEATAQVSFMHVPIKIEESYKYNDVNFAESVVIPPRVATGRDTLIEQIRKVRAAMRDSTSLEGRDALRDSLRALVRRRGDAPSRYGCRSNADTAVIRGTRYEESLPVYVRVPCDTAVLARSADLPPSIYEPGEELFGASQRAELLKELDFGMQPGWAPQKIQWKYGPSEGLLRYNRVEGLSAALLGEQTLGQGYRVHGLVRLGTADLEPNGELGIARTDGRRTFGLAVFRRLEAANDWGTPLGFGPSLSALLFGRDEGFYYRTAGAELTGTMGDREGLRWRLFGERHDAAEMKTRISLAGSRFRPNITAAEGLVAGLATTLHGSYGLDPHGWRLLADVRAEGAAGSFEYGRGLVDATLSRGLTRRLDAAITLSGGAATTQTPAQRLFYVGGSNTVRGQPAGALSGPVFWLGRAELGSSNVAARPVLFADFGWAGARGDLTKPGLPLSGVGIGSSFLDGLIRFDLAKGINPDRKVRGYFYVESRF